MSDTFMITVRDKSRILSGIYDGNYIVDRVLKAKHSNTIIEVSDVE
jgi:hypothetical protein